MEASLIMQKALDAMPFEPVPSQLAVMMSMSEFIVNPDPRLVFVLNGYAGTGKTSVVGAMIRALDSLKRPVVVLAPTGRAAKVASALSSHEASTIHRRLFRPVMSEAGAKSWFIAPNQCRDTLFIVDEASLIPDREGDPRSLLKVLVDYVHSAPGCRMVLIGDEAQLPPVGQEFATAMNPERLKQLGLTPICTTLDVPLRQASDSGIVHNATLVRSFLFNDPLPSEVSLELSGFPDIMAVSSLELAELLADSYSQVGQDETLIITRSNRRANDFNRQIRARVLYADSPVQTGDRLVISKNDYFWSKDRKHRLIANGDMACVKWVGKTEKMYGRYFTEVELELSEGNMVTAQLMLRSLVCEGPSIPHDEMDRFTSRALAEQEGVLSERLKALDEDPYYNALQAKYAYCVTCHKAQGGQWSHVYIDMGGIAPEQFDEAFYRWLYTAVTRATSKVYLINPTFPLS